MSRKFCQAILLSAIVPFAIAPAAAAPGAANATVTPNGGGAPPSSAPAAPAGVGAPANTGTSTAPAGALIPIDFVTQPLTEGDAVSLGLAHNPQISGGLAGLASAEATYKSTAAFPPINLGVTTVSGSSAAPTLNGNDSDTFVDLGGTIDTSGQRRLQAAGQKATYRATRFQFEETRLTLTQQIRDAYWSLVAARSQTQMNLDSLHDQQHVSDLTKQQLDAGAAPRGDVLRSSIDLANAQQAYITAQGAERSALYALNSVLGRDPAAPLQLADTLTEENLGKLPIATLPPLPDLTSAALANRPAVKAASEQVNSAIYSVKQSRAARLPDVSVDYERSLRDPIDAWIIAAHMPLLDFGSISQSIKAAHQTQLQTQAQRTQAQLQVAQQVTQGYQDYTQAQQLASSYLNDILAPSVTLLDMSQLGYKQGATGILPVIDAENTLRSARIGYVNALLAVYKARDEVEAATGAPIAATAPLAVPAAR